MWSSSVRSNFKVSYFFLSTRRIISYSANSSFDVLTFFLVMQTSKIVLECFSAFVKSAENLFGCDLIENIFVHFCYSTKCFLSVSFLYAEGNDLFGVITCWPLGLFWTYCSASQGPCSFVPHSLVTETKTSAQELSWRNVDNWEKQFYPTKFSHKDGWDNQHRAASFGRCGHRWLYQILYRPCSLKGNVFLLQTFGKGVSSAFSKFILVSSNWTQLNLT